jgi:phosphoribosylaminoimidazolecarboxamide formyltransferase/IMP cyclohydrolase
MARLHTYAAEHFLDLKSLIDGGIIAQWSFLPETLTREQLQPASVTHKGVEYRIDRPPTAAEAEDLLFGWLIEAGVASNSVLYVKDQASVGIGAGQQDRVGVAELARDRAYRNTSERIARTRFGKPLAELTDPDQRRAVSDETTRLKGGLLGAAMVSDAFFPFRDGLDVGIREGITSVIQPGGALRDHEIIQACNEHNVAMVFTGQRSFKH